MPRNIIHIPTVSYTHIHAIEYRFPSFEVNDGPLMIISMDFNESWRTVEVILWGHLANKSMSLTQFETVLSHGHDYILSNVDVEIEPHESVSESNGFPKVKRVQTFELVHFLPAEGPSRVLEVWYADEELFDFGLDRIDGDIVITFFGPIKNSLFKWSDLCEIVDHAKNYVITGEVKF